MATVAARGRVGAARKHASVVVRCPGETTCRGRIALRRGSARVGRTTFSVRRGTRRRASLRMTRFGRRVVRPRVTKVAARVQTKQAVTKRRVTLRRVR